MKQHRKTFTLVAALIILAAVAYIRYGQLPDRAKGSVAIVEGYSSPTAHQHIPENKIAAQINAPSDVLAAPKPFPADGLTEMLRFDSEKKFLHDKLRHEGRDETWATRSESLFDKVYAALPSIGDAGRDVAISCGTTLCEVSGSLDDRPGERDNKAQASVQSPDLVEKMWDKGYHNMGSMFGPDDQGRLSFVTFYQREAPATVKSGLSR